MGYLLLEGGAEFGGKMSEPDRKAIERAGGPEAPIRIIPTAAAPDDNHQRAGENGVRWFRSLGAKDVGRQPCMGGRAGGLSRRRGRGREQRRSDGPVPVLL
jgi:cyanophycinase-like exopeptidase